MTRGLWLAAMLTATTAAAWEARVDSEGDVVRWSGRVQFSLDRRLAEKLGERRAATAIRAALAEVAKAAPGLTIDAQESAGELVMGYDLKQSSANQNVVVALDEWPFASNNLAATVVTVNRKTNEIIDADIAFNVDEFDFDVLDGDGRFALDTNDIQNTMTHELGHAFGLMHNDEDRMVVMFPASPAGETHKRVLAPDDRQGLEWLYARAAPPPSDEAPATGCSSTGGAPGLLLSAVMLALRGWRRRAVAVAVVAPVVALASEPEQAARPAPTERALVGQVTSTQSRWLPGRVGVMVTDVEVKVLACDAPCEKVVTVTMPGGRIGDLEQLVVHNPVPKSGETVLVKKGARTSVSIIRWVRTAAR